MLLLIICSGCLIKPALEQCYGKFYEWVILRKWNCFQRSTLEWFLSFRHPASFTALPLRNIPASALEPQTVLCFSSGSVRVPGMGDSIKMGPCWQKEYESKWLKNNQIIFVFVMTAKKNWLHCLLLNNYYLLKICPDGVAVITPASHTHYTGWSI